MRLAAFAALLVVCACVVPAASSRLESLHKHGARIRVLSETDAQGDISSPAIAAHTVSEDDPWDMAAFQEHLDEDLDREFPVEGAHGRSASAVEHDSVEFVGDDGVQHRHGHHAQAPFRFNQQRQGLQALNLLRETLAMSASVFSKQPNGTTGTTGRFISSSSAAGDLELHAIILV